MADRIRTLCGRVMWYVAATADRDCGRITYEPPRRIPVWDGRPAAPGIEVQIAHDGEILPQTDGLPLAFLRSKRRAEVITHIRTGREQNYSPLSMT